MISAAGQKTDPTGWETLELFAHASAFNRWLFSRISSFCKGEVLEVGSGIGNISAFLLGEQLKVSLSDLRMEYCRLLEERFTGNPHLSGVYQIDLSIPDFDSRYRGLLNRFDTVIALNVVEHIEQDLRTVQNAKSLLRDQGKLVVLVPAGAFLYNTFDRALGHYKRYTKATVCRLLETAGLTRIHASYFNLAGIPGWWFSGSVLKKKIIPRSQLKFYNQLVPVFRMIDQLTARTAGLSVIAVATNQLTRNYDKTIY